MARASFVSFIFLTAFFLSVFSLDDPNDFCRPFLSCQTCLDAGHSCGWCGNVCLYGNSSGPLNTTMKCPLWKTDSCLINCHEYADCATCLFPENDCVWCQSNNTSNSSSLTSSCLTASNSSKCDASSSLYTATCPDPKCHQATTCDACISDSCSWCSDQNTCLPTLHAEATCKNVRQGTCEDDCYNHSDCGQCVADPRCGWCDGYCTPGNANGSSVLTCEEWICQNCSISSCSKVDCSVYQTCAECAESKLCGWCDDSDPKTYGCHQSEGSCTLWMSDTCDFIECAGHRDDCEGCLLETGCSWCTYRTTDDDLAKGCFANSTVSSDQNVVECNQGCNPRAKSVTIVFSILVLLISVVAFVILVVSWWRRRSQERRQTTISYEPILTEEY